MGKADRKSGWRLQIGKYYNETHQLTQPFVFKSGALPWQVALILLSAQIIAVQAEVAHRSSGVRFSENEGFCRDKDCAPAPLKLTKGEVKRKVVVDPNSGLTKKACDKAIVSMVAKAKKLGPPGNHVVSPFKAKNFRVVCTTEKMIRRNLAPNIPKEISPAVFIPSDPSSTTYPPTVYIPVSKDSASNKKVTGVLGHEMMHASTFFRHSKLPCKRVDEWDLLTPVHPVTQKEMKKYHKAFQAGDDRIRHFEKLLGKESLSKKEKQTLKKYQKATKECHVTDVIGPLGEEQYNSILDAGWKKGGPTIEFVMGEGRYKVINIDESNHDYGGAPVGTFQPVDAVSTVLAIPHKIVKMLADFKARGSVLKEMTAERETYTFEHLTPEAIRVFYPEALALREEYLKKCEPSHVSSARP